MFLSEGLENRIFQQITSHHEIMSIKKFLTGDMELMIAHLERSGIFKTTIEEKEYFRSENAKCMIQGVLAKDFLGAPSGSAICFYIKRNPYIFRAKYISREQAEAFGVQKWCTLKDCKRLKFTYLRAFIAAQRAENEEG